MAAPALQKTRQPRTQNLQSGQPLRIRPRAYCCAPIRTLGLAEMVQEASVTEFNDRKIADDDKISQDRREALRYALALGSGAALAAAVSSPASAQAADNTLDKIRANKVLRIAVLPGELPYFSKDLASGTWSGMCIEMAGDIAKLLDVKLEYTESTYGNSILDLQANKIDLGFALNPTPQRALVVEFLRRRLPSSLWGHAQEGAGGQDLGRHQQASVNIAVDAGSANETVHDGLRRTRPSNR